MHILVVTQYFWPENFRINDLVDEWLDRGYQVTVLTGVPNYPSGKVFDDYLVQPEAYLLYRGARVVRVPIISRGKGGGRLVLNYLSFVISSIAFGIWQLRSIKPDVIFVFEPSPVTVGFPAIIFSRIKRCPVVLWVLDLWPDTLVAMGVVRSPSLLGLIGRCVRFLYDQCTLVLGQSRSFLGSIANYCSDQTKIRYFPSWAEDVYNEGESTLQAPEVPELKNGFTVMFAGNIGEAQDMPSVLNAVWQLRDNAAIRWVIIGDGRKFEWLRQEVRKRGLEHRVLLTGRYGVERMRSFYLHADALLVSLKREPVFNLTIPGKVQSYMIAGIPILGMLDGEGASVIKDANAGLICSAGDALNLANIVLELASMSVQERQQLGINGREYASREFGRAQLMDRMDLFLNEAIALHSLRSCQSK